MYSVGCIYIDKYENVSRSTAVGQRAPIVGDGLSRLCLGVYESEDGADPEEGAAGTAHPGILRQRGDHEAHPHERVFVSIVLRVLSLREASNSVCRAEYTHLKHISYTNDTRQGDV